MGESISLKLIKAEEEFHAGWGAGSGTVIYEEYVCPCGKGIVVYEKDDIPGFKDSSTMASCQDCNTKYSFKKGTAYSK